MSGAPAPEPQPHLDNMRAMVVAALGLRLTPGIERFSDLFADDAVMEVPFDDDLRLEGRAAIDKHMHSLRGSIVLGPMTVTGRYPCGPDEIVLEYNGHVDDIRHAVTFHQTYIGVFRTSGGRLVLWREYLNPMNLPKNAREARS